MVIKKRHLNFTNLLIFTIIKIYDIRFEMAGRYLGFDNFADFDFYDIDASDPLPPGKVTLRLEYVSKETPNGSTIVQQPAAQIPWFHDCILLEEVENKKERAWYDGSAMPADRLARTSSAAAHWRK